MNKADLKKESKLYDIEIDGVFGQFNTKDSNKLNYLLATFSIDHLHLLESANSAFDLNDVSFEDLVQRDIDYKRVDDDIVKEYLEKGENRVIFFPPLLVAVMPIKDKKPLKKYPEMHPAQISDDTLKLVWGDNKFEVDLVLSDKETKSTYYCPHNKRAYNFLEYLTTFKANSKYMKLVVVDGQHRLMALKRITESGNNELLENVYLPVCIFFSPGASESEDSGETVTRNMRELFVTINTKAKEVSGHFTTLLDDNSLASYCIRDLVRQWKTTFVDNKFCILHLLEWNQREKRKANQLDKKFSITNIGIIADCLSRYIFDKKNGGLTNLLLNLSERQNILEEDEDATKIDNIAEDNFDFEQIDVIKQQIEKYITPSLTTIFTEPHPYKAIMADFSKTYTILLGKIDKSETGAKQYHDDILLQFRKTTKRDQAKVKDMEKWFSDQFDNSSVYYLNVFQQAIIRLWANLSKEFCSLFTSDVITPVNIAKGIVDSGEIVIFCDKRDFLNRAHVYTQNVLFSNDKVIVTETSKDQFTQILQATYMNEKSRSLFVDSLMKSINSTDKNKQKGLNDILYNCAISATEAYFDSYFDANKSDLKKRWQYKGLDGDLHSYLYARFNSEDEVKQKEFENKIIELCVAQSEKARKIFDNIVLSR
jgi:hypothetical protein